MYIVGFATAVEIADLEDQGLAVEDASYYGLVSPRTTDRSDGDAAGTGRDSYLMAKPEPGPDGTKAITVFLDAALYDVMCVLRAFYDNPDRKDHPLWHAYKEAKARLGGLSVRGFVSRKNRLICIAQALRAEAEDHKYCSHKNTDGSDARYPTGNGELACICGNKWD
jgi:hypothetical protein